MIKILTIEKLKNQVEKHTDEIKKIDERIIFLTNENEKYKNRLQEIENLIRENKKFKREKLKNKEVEKIKSLRKEVEKLEKEIDNKRNYFEKVNKQRCSKICNKL